MKLRNPFQRKSIKQVTEDEIAEAIVIHAVDEPITNTAQQGRVVKAQTKQFNMDETRHGGRVVKAMPKQLRHMKELSEKTDD